MEAAHITPRNRQRPELVASAAPCAAGRLGSAIEALGSAGNAPPSSAPQQRQADWRTTPLPDTPTQLKQAPRSSHHPQQSASPPAQEVNGHGSFTTGWKSVNEYSSDVHKPAAMWRQQASEAFRAGNGHFGAAGGGGCSGAVTSPMKSWQGPTSQRPVYGPQAPESLRSGGSHLGAGALSNPMRNLHLPSQTPAADPQAFDPSRASRPQHNAGDAGPCHAGANAREGSLSISPLQAWQAPVPETGPQANDHWRAGGGQMGSRRGTPPISPQQSLHSFSRRAPAGSQAPETTRAGGGCQFGSGGGGAMVNLHQGLQASPQYAQPAGPQAPESLRAGGAPGSHFSSAGGTCLDSSWRGEGGGHQPSAQRASAGAQGPDSMRAGGSQFAARGRAGSDEQTSAMHGPGSVQASPQKAATGPQANPMHGPGSFQASPQRAAAGPQASPAHGPGSFQASPQRAAAGPQAEATDSLRTGSPPLGPAGPFQSLDIDPKAAAAAPATSAVAVPTYAPQASSQQSSPPASPDEAPCAAAASAAGPQVFSMAADDDSSEDAVPPEGSETDHRSWFGAGSDEGGRPEGGSALGSGASDDFEMEGCEEDDEGSDDRGHLGETEMADYDAIEEQLARFKAKQREMQEGAAELLARLNTRIHMPGSSVASSSDFGSELGSECGDSEGFMSAMGSRHGSRQTTPFGSPRGSEHGGYTMGPLERAAATRDTQLAMKLKSHIASISNKSIGNSPGTPASVQHDMISNPPLSARGRSGSTPKRANSLFSFGPSARGAVQSAWNGARAACSFSDNANKPSFHLQAQAPSDGWRGWSMIATAEGRLFFHNENSRASQWSQPQDLDAVLGTWVEVDSEGLAEQRSFWRNDVLQLSLWKDPRQTTNIFQAALDGNLFFMQLYSQVEGDLNVIDPNGLSAFHYACAGGSTQCALFLVHRKADLEVRDTAGATPLGYACRYGYAGVAKVILDAGADVNAPDSCGTTPLHEAACMGSVDCVNLLLVGGANQFLRTSDGDTAADIANQRGNEGVLGALRQHQLPRFTQASMMSFASSASEAVATGGIATSATGHNARFFSISSPVHSPTQSPRSNLQQAQMAQRASPQSAHFEQKQQQYQQYHPQQPMRGKALPNAQEGCANSSVELNASSETHSSHETSPAAKCGLALHLAESNCALGKLA